MERFENGWRLRADGMLLDIDRKTGCLSRLVIHRSKEQVWTQHSGDVTVRDDRLERTFGRRHLEHVDFAEKGDALIIRKTFQGAPWVLEETYREDGDVLNWDAALTLDSGEYRSCEISYHIPWLQPLYPMTFWAAREGMPSAPHRFAEIALEYGESTSGIMIPALCCYRKDLDIGLLLAMPFDFRTPRFRFISGYRDPDLQVSFDRMALAPGKPARTKFFMRACEPDWRPALGWLYERYREYFEPRSTLIHKLWGGHISGTFNVSSETAQQMKSLEMKWHEIHAHFPLYGNYHPEGIETWRSGHEQENTTLISVDMIRRTIKNLHEAGIAALPYLQVTGDGAETLPAEFEGSRLRDYHGDTVTAWPTTSLMNSDPSLPFGRDIVRQIDGMVERYPEMDGVFLDQPCYNFLDTAHDDGLTAVNNRPCYMTGFNYFPHLERLSSLLHPGKAIIGNAPFGVGILKYVDGFMAEADGRICDHLQYYGIGPKPMFFLEYKTGDANVEQMFQRCLVYAAGFTSYPGAIGSKDLYDLYVPLLQRLYCRRWVFDTEPLQLPAAFKGNVFRGANGSLLVSMVKGMTALTGHTSRDTAVSVRTADIDNVRRVTLQHPGGAVTPVPFSRDKGAVVFDIPPQTVAAVAELEY